MECMCMAFPRRRFWTLLVRDGQRAYRTAVLSRALCAHLGGARMVEKEARGISERALLGFWRRM